MPAIVNYSCDSAIHSKDSSLGITYFLLLYKRKCEYQADFDLEPLRVFSARGRSLPGDRMA